MTRATYGPCKTCKAWMPVLTYDPKDRACKLYPQWRITSASHGCFQHIP